MKNLNLDKKKLYLYFIFLGIISLIFKLYSYKIFPAKYFYDFNKILKLSLGYDILTDKGYSFTANIYKYINIFNFTTLQEWAVFLFVILQLILFLFFKKLKIKKINICELGVLSLGYLFFSLYVLNTSKEYIQFIVFNICYFIIIRNKNQLYVFFIMLIMSYFFRGYLILILSLYIIFNKIGFSWLYKKKKIFLVLLIGVLGLYIIKIFLPSTYITLITIRYTTNEGRIGSLDAQSMIMDTFKNPSLNPIIYLINFITMFFRLMFPIELVRKVKYLPYITFQCYLSFIIVKKILTLKKNKIINFIIAFMLVSSIFEPDFGSMLKHQMTLLLFYYDVILRKRVRRRKKMDIAIVINSLGSGGAEKLVLETSKLMKEKGHKIEVVVLSRYKEVYGEMIKRNGIKVKYLSSHPKNHINPFNVLKLVKNLKNKKMVYVNLYQSEIWCGIASLFLPKVKFVSIIHSTMGRNRGEFFYELIDKWLYSRYYKVISITKKVEKNLLKHLGIEKEEKFVVIENGVDFKKINTVKKASRKKYGYSTSDKLLIMVARFSEAKDQKTLIKAMELLSKEYKLLFVGEGNLMEEHRKLAKELKVSDRVNFLGFRRDIPELLKMCDVGILSSHWEGFGLVAVETMASGIPIIASNVEGLADVVRGAGILFEKGNEKELNEKIKILCENKEFYDDVIKNCLIRSEKYKMEKMVYKYLDLY